MMYLLAVFVPPLYFLVKKKYLAFLVHTILCLSAIPLLFFFGFGIILWVISMICALWDLRKQLMEVTCPQFMYQPL